MKEYARSLGRHGFRLVYFVPSHGGNFAPVQEAIAELGGRVGEARIAAYTDLPAFLEVLYASQRPFGVTPERAGAHAGNTETALVLALRPELARPERAEEGFVGAFDQAAQELIFREGLRTLTANGILGDARGAEPTLGTACLDALADHLADRIRLEFKRVGLS